MVFVIPLHGQIFHVDQIQPRRNRVYETRNLPTISYGSLKSDHYTPSLSNTLSLSKFKHSHSNTQIRQTLSVSQSLKHSHSNTKITHPHPSNALLFPHNRLHTIPSPIPSKSLLSLPTEVQIFSILKVCFLICMFIYREMRNNLWSGKGTFSYKNLSFLNIYSIWVSFFSLQNLAFFGLFCEIEAFDMRNLHWN